MQNDPRPQKRKWLGIILVSIIFLCLACLIFGWILQTFFPSVSTTTPSPSAPIIISIPSSTPLSPTPAPQWELISVQGVFHLVVIDPIYKTDRQALIYISKNICASDDICKVLFWDDKSKAANSLPMTDLQVNAEVANYSFNKNTSLDKLLICNQGSCE